MGIKKIVAVLAIFALAGCKQNEAKKIKKPITTEHLSLSQNILDFKGAPKEKAERGMLMFSDQGAWFAYGLPDSVNTFGGFSGPFLMTQEMGCGSVRIWPAYDSPIVPMTQKSWIGKTIWSSKKVMRVTWNLPMKVMGYG